MAVSGLKYLIGIDAGTSSIKGLLINDKGAACVMASREYTLESGPNGRCEIEAEIYWVKTCEVIRDLLGKSGADPQAVAGLAISSQGETMIIVDDEGKPLRKAIVWLDNRSVAEAEEISRVFNKQQVMDITGLPEILPTWPATTILWIKNSEPEVFRKASKFLMLEDYLMYRLTGRYCTEHSIASDTLYFDIAGKKWWNSMLSFLGISEEHLPEPLPSGAKVENLTPDAAVATGLTVRAKCVTGSYDHPAGAIGAGSIAPGMVTLTIGSSMAMCVPLKEPVRDISLRLPCQCHSINGLYFLLPYSSTAGLALRWFRDEFCSEEIKEAERLNTDPYFLMTEKASTVKPGADGLMMLPHLAGTGSPEFNPYARGSFTGITLGMNKGHFIRSIMEAVACCVESNLRSLRLHGYHFSEIRLLGGASRSPLWSQIIADVTNTFVVTMKQTDTASLGAAILAGTGLGIFPDMDSACKICTAIDSGFEPDTDKSQTYRKVYEQYISLSTSLEKFW